MPALRDYLINLLSRKFLFCLFVISVSAGLLFYRLLPSNIFGEIAMFVSGAYLTSNVATRYAKTKENVMMMTEDAEDIGTDALQMARPMGISRYQKRNSEAGQL